MPTSRGAVPFAARTTLAGCGRDATDAECAGAITEELAVEVNREVLGHRLDL